MSQSCRRNSVPPYGSNLPAASPARDARVPSFVARGVGTLFRASNYSSHSEARRGMSERVGDQQAGTARSPASAGDVSRLPFGTGIETRSMSTGIETRSMSEVLTAIRDRAEDAAARTLRLRGSDSFSFGIEEEYFVVDAKTKGIVLTRPAQFLADAKRILGDQVAVEM